MTAVEWLIQEHFGGIENCTPDFRYHIEQALEMEKQQIIDAYKADLYPCSDEDAEQYYNETFKSESFCNCPKGKGIDFEENQKAYCIDCGKNIINL